MCVHLDEIMDKLKAISERLKREYHAEKVILFGSYARGEEDNDSDIDFLIVLKNLKPKEIEKEIEKISYIITEFCSKYEKLISVYPIPSEWFQKRLSPLFINARKEGIPI